MRTLRQPLPSVSLAQGPQNGVAGENMHTEDRAVKHSSLGLRGSTHSSHVYALGVCFNTTVAVAVGATTGTEIVGFVVGSAVGAGSVLGHSGGKTRPQPSMICVTIALIA